MSSLQTKYFGVVEYAPQAVFHFESGIPGFESETEFVFLEQPRTNPLVFMQSLSSPELCFIAVSSRIADPEYCPSLSQDDREALRLSDREEPITGQNVLCFALVTMNAGNEPTCNLAAPVLLNPRSGCGVQALTGYSEDLLRKPLINAKGPASC